MANHHDARLCVLLLALRNLRERGPDLSGGQKWGSLRAARKLVRLSITEIAATQTVLVTKWNAIANDPLATLRFRS